jgi:hypothetical protein
MSGEGNTGEWMLEKVDQGTNHLCVPFYLVGSLIVLPPALCYYCAYKTDQLDSDYVKRIFEMK